MAHIKARSFFREQDQRMDTSDDDIQEYRARMVPSKRRPISTMHNDRVVASKKTGTQRHTPDRVVTRSDDSKESSTRRTSSRKRKPSIVNFNESSVTKRRRVGSDDVSTEDWTSSPITIGGPLTNSAESSLHHGPVSRVIRSSNFPKRQSRRKGTDEATSQDQPANNPEQNSPPGHSSSIPVPDFPNKQVYDDGHPVGYPSSPIEDPSGLPSASTSGPAMGSAGTLLEEMRKAALNYHSERSMAGQHSAKKARPKVRKLVTTTIPHDTDQSSIIHVSSSPEPSPEPRPTRLPGASTAAASTRKGKITNTVSNATVTGRKPAGGKKLKGPLNSKGEKPFPDEYARMLQEKAEELREKAPNEGQFLRGMKIFFYGGDRTVATLPTIGKMEKARHLERCSVLLHRVLMPVFIQIVRYGADIADEYDSAVVTHIIVDKEAGRSPFLHALRLRKLTDIPNHIPTLKWGWVQDAISKYLNYRQTHKDNPIPDFEITMGHYWDHARFGERIDAGGDVNDFLSKARMKKDDFSHISEFSVDGIATGKRFSHRVKGRGDNGDLENLKRQKSKFQPASSSRVPLDLKSQYLEAKLAKEDPLEEFYPQAMSECLERDGQRYGEVDGSDDESSENIQLHIRKGDGGKGTRSRPCPNQDVVDKLEELMELHKVKPSADDKWRVYSYTRSISSLRNHPKRIRSLEDALALPGIGKKTAEKIMEIIRTGDLRRIKWENTDDVTVLKLFRGVYGVGSKTGMQWYNAGVRTLDDLRAGKYGIKLSPAQQIGLRYYNEINSRMPRSEARRIFDLIKTIALSIDPGLVLRHVGSYRRGKADCGDIDIIITRDDTDGKTHHGVLRRLLRKLHAAGILTEDLALPEDAKLDTTYRGLCHLPGVPGARRRRIDFLSTTWKSRGAALIYYTGDDIVGHGVLIIVKAHKMGYSLDQHGLWDGVIRNPSKPREKFQKGNIIASETEEEIFKVLGVPWQEPRERVRNFNTDLEPVIPSRPVKPIEVVDEAESDSDD
ncbi:hypothetical protein D9758_006472 [Tetrapyrgos nigripes]|uniref:DNA polymerase beta n=1 Tax=Tetrapyrgos nigripes TaxID=182062 RepID=A0A8H5GL76_9AGAR|nr:hypothetical protein D9758_006472 [Tetrapyrgos nigripes]